MSNYPGTQPDAPITEPQANYLRSLARRLQTNPDQEAVEYFPELEIKGISELKRAQASELIDFLKSQDEG